MAVEDILHFRTLEEAQTVFKALSAPMRIKILELLTEEGDKNLNDLAQLLNLTNSAISLHIRCLEEAGLISIHTTAGKRGSMKICKPLYKRIMIDMKPEEQLSSPYYEDAVSVGCYNRCDIHPTCGIATPQHCIGEFDNPKYFQFSDRFLAGILWLGSGFVEYTLPNRLIPGQNIKKISLSFEISSECPGINEDYPSDIQFYLNDIYLGYWVSPGDYGARTGRFTPGWWPRHCNQYGLLKTLSITSEGTFIDGGNKISDVTIEQLSITYRSHLTFRFQVSQDAKNCGGMTLFGKEFGDYNQDILFRIYY